MSKNTNIESSSVFDVNEYFGKYNHLLSCAAKEFGDSFSAIASPTLSKQETVTNLYSCVCELRRTGKRSAFTWGSLIEFVPRLCLTFYNLIYASLRFRVKYLPLNCIYFRTWLVPRSMQGDNVVDDYFRSLPDDLSEENDVVVSFQPLDYKLLKNVKKHNLRNNYIIAVGLLSVFDIIKLFVDYIITAHLKVHDKYIFNKSNITPLINHSLSQDYLQLRSFQAYLDKYISRKLIRYNLKSFVYVFENQSWEKACCCTLDRQNTKLISYQSSGFSPVFLNFFPTAMDADRQPMPDMILTVGDLFTKYLLDNGTYKIPVKTFAALRFSHPNNGDRYLVTKPNSILFKKILYAFPVQVSQYKNTIDDLIKVFANTPISIDLKFHPIIKQKKINTFDSIPGNFNVVQKVDMATLSDTYDLVLFNDNSFGIESLLMGVKPYQYNTDKKNNDERFFYFNLWDTHLNFDGLLQLRDSIMNGDYEKSYDVSAVTDYLNSMYRPYAGNPGLFLDCINSLK